MKNSKPVSYRIFKMHLVCLVDLVKYLIYYNFKYEILANGLFKFCTYTLTVVYMKGKADARTVTANCTN